MTINVKNRFVLTLQKRGQLEKVRKFIENNISIEDQVKQKYLNILDSYDSDIVVSNWKMTNTKDFFPSDETIKDKKWNDAGVIPSIQILKNNRDSVSFYDLNEKIAESNLIINKILMIGENETFEDFLQYIKLYEKNSFVVNPYLSMIPNQLIKILDYCTKNKIAVHLLEINSGDALVNLDIISQYYDKGLIIGMKQCFYNKAKTLIERYQNKVYENTGVEIEFSNKASISVSAFYSMFGIRFICKKTLDGFNPDETIELNKIDSVDLCIKNLTIEEKDHFINTFDDLEILKEFVSLKLIIDTNNIFKDYNEFVSLKQIVFKLRDKGFYSQNP